jgi:hypothetical protein
VFSSENIDPEPTVEPAPTDAPMSSTVAPSNEPTLETTLVTTTLPTTKPANETCYVCGNEVDTPIREDTEIQLPSDQGGFFTVTCQQVFQDGRAGNIPSGDVCEFVSTAVQSQCGCAPPDYTCNICDPSGDQDLVVTDTEEEISIPGVGSQSCEEINEAGQNRLISPDECEGLAALAADACGCAPVGFNCSICGDNFQVTKPDVQVVLESDPDTEYTCGDLEMDGAAGALTPAQCAEAESSLQSDCGCAPLGGFAVCSICGDDSETFTPETEFSLSGFEATTCGNMQQRGYDGQLSPAECIAVQIEASATCSCAASDYICNICGEGEEMSLPEANLTVPDLAMMFNCGDLELAALDGMITPTECIVIAPVASIACGCAPANFTCSICGEGMTPTELNATFIPGEELTCGEGHDSGMSGILTPTECGLYEPLALLSCGCEKDISVAAPTLSPATDGSVMTTSPSVGEDTATDADVPSQNPGPSAPSGESADNPALSGAAKLSYLSSTLIVFVATLYV